MIERITGNNNAEEDVTIDSIDRNLDPSVENRSQFHADTQDIVPQESNVKTLHSK